jgi:acetyl-CoA C-acetyltransferase
MDLGVNIIGSYHSKFGKLPEETLYTLYQKAAIGALSNAGIDAADIDGVFVGNYSGGSLNHQENIASYGVNVLPALRHKPMYRTETACTSGSSAVHMGIMAIKSGLMKRVLIVGLEKMTSMDMKQVTQSLALATYWPEEGAKTVTAPCMFADLAKGWQSKHGYCDDQLRAWLAEISAKAYDNAVENRFAHIQKARSAQEILALPDEKNPVINAPLRLHDCSLVSDGSSGIILEAAHLKSSKKSVAIKSFYNASDFLDSFGKNKSDHFLEGTHFAVNKVLKDAQINISDINIAEVHDCFTITEMLIYSAMGLSLPGREFEVIESKMVHKGGKLPINLSGGLKAKGHPIGATGVAMHAFLYKQLIGEADCHQIDNPDLGLVVNIGGSGTSNCASVLQKN